MKKSWIFVLGLILSTPALSSPSHPAQWDYDESNGPEHWATLSPDYSSCSGKNQSPVNLTGFVESALPELKLHYAQGGDEILNNGHTVQVNFEKGSTLEIDNTSFKLLQFHFHAPSENHIDGKAYPLEAHLVHADEAGHLLVVALMFETGIKNNALATMWNQLPEHSGEKHPLSELINANDLLPANHAYYRYNGSLTTPPCTEGVRWLVIKKPVTASTQQIAKIKQALHHANNRPVQSLNARLVLQ